MQLGLRFGDKKKILCFGYGDVVESEFDGGVIYCCHLRIQLKR